MNIGFYINGFPCNKKYDALDCGNPGIGGTQYMFWLVASELARRNNGLEVSLFTQDSVKMIPELHVIQVDSFDSALKSAVSQGVDILVIRGNASSRMLSSAEYFRVPIVTWSHNFETSSFIKDAASSSAVVANICVGYQQLDRLRDADLFKKSLVIPNAIDCDLYNRFIGTNDIGNKLVTYMGSIVPAKGFHRLAKIWPRVIRQIPEARLRVIGSGALYSGNCGRRFGSLGIAAPEYEETFARYISKSGILDPSIEFMGAMGGLEKMVAMADTSVAVVNPTARSETFCIVGAEFEAMGIPVVAPAHFGCLDTVKNGLTGLTFNSDRQFVDSIVRLLSDPGLNRRLGNQAKEFINNNFDVRIVIEEWERLVCSGFEHSANRLCYDNILKDGKWIREANRVIKTIPLFSRFPSMIEFETFARKIIRR